MLIGTDGKDVKDRETDTNSTQEESYRTRYVLVDTGRSGELVIGDETLALARRATKGIFRNPLASPQRKTRYIFGAGRGVEATRRVLLSHRALCTILCDVVPGKVPLLAGRRLLKRLKVILDFGPEYIRCWGLGEKQLTVPHGV